MVRIRKRSLAAASSSGKQELHEISNGGLHLYAGPKSNHSFQDPKSSSPSIIMQDHLLLTGSGYGFPERPAHKQIKEGAVKSSAASCESRARKNDIAIKGGGNSVQEYEVKRMHMQDDGEAQCMDIKAVTATEGGLAETSGRGGEAEACKKERHGASITCSDPAIADAVDVYPRKVLPLQLILMSSESRVTAQRIPAQNIINNNHDKTAQYLTSSGSTVSAPSKTVVHTPLKLSREKDAAEEKKAASPSTGCRKAGAGALPSSAAAGGSSKNDVDSEFAGVRIHEDMKLRRSEVEANKYRCSQNSTHESLERPVSSWQGHRRARSFLQGGRTWTGFNGPPNPSLAGCRPSVNPEVHLHGLFTEEEKQLKIDPREKEKSTKKPRKPLHNFGTHPSLQPPHTSATATASSAAFLGDGKLKQLQGSRGVTKNNINMIKKKDQSLSAKLISSVIGKLKVGSKNRKRAAAPTDDHLEMTVNAVPDNHVASPSSSAHDHNFMRCRRKDGRRWRCKEQVMKAGAPFCHYHTLKMREKHAARRLSKQPQLGEAEKADYAESSKSGRKRAASKRRRIRSSPTIMAMEDRYGTGCYQEEEGEEEEEEKNVHAIKLGKRQVKVLQEAGSSRTVKRRWRKKCKPCIRRLHDIHDRARPAATNGLDFTNSLWEDKTIANMDSPRPAMRVSSPLPECLLNTDPHEWRSDFP